MYQNLFEEIGLSPNEARVYENLLGKENFSVPALSKKIGIHRRNVYDALDRLAKKNFVEKNTISGIIHFRPRPPRELLQFLKSKERKFSDALPEIERLYKCKISTDESRLQRGELAMADFLLSLTRVKKEFFAIGRLLFWNNEMYKNEVQKIQTHLMHSAIGWRVVISVKGRAVKNGENVRQTASLYPTVIIHDDLATILTNEHESTNVELFTVKDRESVRDYRALAISVTER